MKPLAAGDRGPPDLHAPSNPPVAPTPPAYAPR